METRLALLAGAVIVVVLGGHPSLGLGAGPGDLDPGFGTGGKVTTDFRSRFSVELARRVALQADGKVVAAGSTNGSFGDFGVARYNADGTLDATFGTGGKVVTDFGPAEHGADVKIQPDGKIVVAGSTGFVFVNQFSVALARYTPDGTLDATFGIGGKVAVDFNSARDSRGFSVAIQPDGKLVVAGFVNHITGGLDFGLMRFNVDGTLDPTFGTGGKVTTDFGSIDTGKDAVIQPDGKIVVAGSSGPDFAVARYNPDGSLDPTFGAGGKVVTDFGFTDNAARLRLQPDGKLVVVGNSIGARGLAIDFEMARYNPDGSLDAGFGLGGKVITDFGGRSDFAADLAFLADGRILLIGGSTIVPPTPGFPLSDLNFDIALARYLPDGTLDPTFGAGGRVVTEFGSPRDVGQGVVLLADGRFLVGGLSSTFDTGDDFAVVRYLPDGTLDTTFGAGGLAQTNFALDRSYDQGQALAVQPDGKLLVAGTTQSVAGQDFAVARYLPDGALDPGFGGDGTVRTDFGRSIETAVGIALQADGKILAAGYSWESGGAGGFALARYNADGTLDPAFGSGGKVVTGFGQFAFGQALALQGDGKILVVGYAYNGTTTGYDFLLARYDPDGTLDGGFGTAGSVVTNFGLTDLATGLLVQPDGRIVVVGTAYTTTGSHVALTRHLPDGSLDGGFGTGGKLTFDFGTPYATGRTAALRADGRLVVGGASYGGTGSDVGLARLHPDGSLDASFGTAGTVTTGFGPSGATLLGVALAADGKIVAAGYAVGATGSLDFMLARYGPDGTLDPVFGVDGTLMTDFAGGSDFAVAVVIQPGGKIVVAGGGSAPGATGGDSDFALARYLVSQPQDDIRGLIGDVEALVAAGTLNGGQGNGLIAKLEAAIHQLDAGNLTAARNQLAAFVNQVTAFMAAGTLSPAEGQPLLDAANAALARLA